MRKRTKIVATISDRHCEVDFLKTLYDNGMDVVRINSAHLTPAGASIIVANVRKVSDRIAILIDTKGPEIRVTAMTDACTEGVQVAAGDRISVRGSATNERSSDKLIFLNTIHIYEDVPVGSSLLIDDGELELQVVDKQDDTLVCEVKNKGVIRGRKSVNVPGVAIPLPSITERDREFIQWAVDEQIDFIAHSFVRKKEDVLAVQKILDDRGSSIKVISKIENREGVENIDEILDATYGIMVARGDLGVEIPAEKLPVVQRELVKKCVQSKKPVIIATQMLHSMIQNPRPTRAEVEDIANAIYQRVDAIMLSGETANGAYPEEAVHTMAKIAREIETDTDPMVDINLIRINNEITAQLARSAVRASIALEVKAVVVDTQTGRTGRYLSAFRGLKPVYAICYRPNIMRELALSYGVYPLYTEIPISHEQFLLNTLNDLESSRLLGCEDLIVVVGGSFGSEAGASFLEIGTVCNLQQKALRAVDHKIALEKLTD